MIILRCVVYTLPAAALTIVYLPFWLLSLIGDCGQNILTKALLRLQYTILK